MSIAEERRDREQTNDRCISENLEIFMIDELFLLILYVWGATEDDQTRQIIQERLSVLSAAVKSFRDTNNEHPNNEHPNNEL